MTDALKMYVSNIVMYNLTMAEKILIIRFSSFGDIVQAMGTLAPLHRKFPEGKVHWLTRSDMAGLLAHNPSVDKLWSFDRKSGLVGLIRLALELRKERFTHVYDAHANIRSLLVALILRFRFTPPYFLKRSKERLKRIMLFKFRKNYFPRPYRGMISFLTPLKKWQVDFDESSLCHDWNFSENEKRKVQLILDEKGLKANEFVALAPSAAWEMKRWPLNHWAELIKLLPNHKLVILGGPQDHFCEELAAIAPERTLNLAGKLSLMESSYLVKLSSGLVSADTGLIHVADILGKKGLALLGPTAFGFPTSPLIQIVDVNLPCRPCTKDGRGKCSMDVYQKCMVDIGPQRVAQLVISFFKN